jgi:hypothetical protein
VLLILSLLQAAGKHRPLLSCPVPPQDLERTALRDAVGLLSTRAGLEVAPQAASLGDALWRVALRIHLEKIVNFRRSRFDFQA